MAEAGVGPNPGAFAKIVSSWFDDRRGLALGIALAGVGVGTAVVPIMATFLIQNFGWRVGYLGLAACILVFSFLPVSLFVHEPTPGEANMSGGSVAPPPTLTLSRPATRSCAAAC